MKVQDVMSTNVKYVPSNMTLSEAAEQMRTGETGFLPIGDDSDDKLKGVITDRDIVVRAVASGRDPNVSTVKDACTDKVLYCFQDDSVEEAAKSMEKQQVYRLVVLDNKDEKRLCGIISLGDIASHGKAKLSGKTAREIVQ